jgi:hypothetical protein
MQRGDVSVATPLPCQARGVSHVGRQSQRRCSAESARDAIVAIALVTVATLVARVASEDCSVHATCADCTVYSPTTPDCGWCALQQQCVLGIVTKKSMHGWKHIFKKLLKNGMILLW